MIAAWTGIRCAVSLFVGALSLAASMNPPALAQGPSPNNSAADQKQVSAIVDGMEDAWIKHDMHALANLFHDDGIWVLWSGQVWKGRKTIEEGHVAVHKPVFRQSIQRKQFEELTFVGEGIAVVRTFETLTGDERYPDKVVRSRKLLVVIRRGGDWKIAWGQDTKLAHTTRDRTREFRCRAISVLRLHRGLVAADRAGLIQEYERSNWRSC